MVIKVKVWNKKKYYTCTFPSGSISDCIKISCIMASVDPAVAQFEVTLK